MFLPTSMRFMALVWCQLTRIQGIDHGTLRRRLVDAGYLTRSKDGSAYQVLPNGAGKFKFETAIEQIDLARDVKDAREELERRKQFYMEKSRKA
jgi:hypothetical protein